MPKPPEAVEVKTRKKFRNSILPQSSTISKYLNESRSSLFQQGRSPLAWTQATSQPPQASQLDLLELLEKSLEPALRIEVVPVDVTVGNSERFCLIHQDSQLRIPGQFSRAEAEHILKATEFWDWEIIESRPRTPRCSYRLFCLLSTVCTPQKALEVIV